MYGIFSIYQKYIVATNLRYIFTKAAITQHLNNTQMYVTSIWNFAALGNYGNF